MREYMEKRLAELKAEHEKGEKMLADLQARQASARDALLRIGGAIVVVEEMLSLQQRVPDGTADGPKTSRDDVMAAMKALTAPERAYVISSFCRCGSTDLGCQCWNDE